MLRLRRAGHLHRVAYEVSEEIRIVVRVNTLHHRREPFQAHAGVDGRLGQGNQFSRCIAIELHEYEVPYLNVTVAVLLGGAGGAARHPGTVIVEYLAARSAGPGVAHGPEIVLLAHASESIRSHTDVPEPNVRRFVVVRIHRAPQPLRRQFQYAGHELPGVLDSLALEVVAEAEVPEHLEERMVARRITDILKVIVLAAGAYAALRTDGTTNFALLAAKKDVLELHHPGVGEQQGRVIGGHQRGARHLFMAPVLKKFQKGLAKFVGGPVHGKFVGDTCHANRNRSPNPALPGSARTRTPASAGIAPGAHAP